ncbi:MAG: hypothetical protein COA79_12510 [Planctomycetota bacterium]|nr:MAG: hypothetical protein COA79_12510 [Planctomycetota bacterium]
MKNYIALLLFSFSTYLICNSEDVKLVPGKYSFNLLVPKMPKNSQNIKLNVTLEQNKTNHQFAYAG